MSDLWDDDMVDGEKEPGLVVGPVTVRASGSVTRQFAWTSGGRARGVRIKATVGGGWVRLRRVRGRLGEGEEPRLTATEVRDLLVVCRDWAKRRDSWAVFDFTQSGYPPGMGGGQWYYQPPGKRSKWVVIGRRSFGALHWGEELRGRDEEVRLARPRRLAPRAAQVAETWRRGERHGPEAGSLVGARYTCGELVVHAERDGLHVVRSSKSDVWLEAGDEEFVAALCKVLASESKPKRAPKPKRKPAPSPTPHRRAARGRRS